METIEVRIDMDDLAGRVKALLDDARLVEQIRADAAAAEAGLAGSAI